MIKLHRRVTQQLSKFSPLLIVLLVAIIGVSILVFSHASSVSVSQEAENGLLSGVTAVSDASASNAKAVKFGSGNTSFTHPGIAVNTAKLDFVKAKIATGAQPWSNEFNILKGGFYGNVNHVPAPFDQLLCSTNNAKAQQYGYKLQGCNEIVSDSQVAYSMALLWYLTGDETYAKKSIEYLNAWSYKLTSIPGLELRYADGSYVYFGQNQLVAAWSSMNWTKAAELMRYTYKTPTTGGWSSADIAQMSKSLDLYYELEKDGWVDGQNRVASALESSMNIALFQNDQNKFDHAMHLLDQNWKVIFYITADGPYPAFTMYKDKATRTTPDQMKTAYFNPSSFVNGAEMETCRDLGHMEMGLAPFLDMMETLHIQGRDVTAAQQARFTAVLETQSDYMNQFLDWSGNVINLQPTSSNPFTPTHNWVCPNSTTAPGSAPGWEIGYNQYATRRGVSLPSTLKLIQRLRTMGGSPSRVANGNIWDALVNAGTP